MLFKMFMNDVYKKEEIRNIAIHDLRELGVKHRPKKFKYQQVDFQHLFLKLVNITQCILQESNGRNGKRVFKTPLHLLPTRTITLKTGQQLMIPKILDELCTYVLTKAETEGLFRKGGSKSRQNEIKVAFHCDCFCVCCKCNFSSCCWTRDVVWETIIMKLM